MSGSRATGVEAGATSGGRRPWGPARDPTAIVHKVALASGARTRTDAPLVPQSPGPGTQVLARHMCEASSLSASGPEATAGAPGGAAQTAARRSGA